MSQLHRRFCDEQVRLLFQSYCAGQLARADVQDVLGIGRSRFFTLLEAFREDAEAFSVAYERRTPARLSAEAEAAIERALLREKALVDDADLPISDYNYTAMRERLAANGIQVSLTTMINRAKELGCHNPRRKRKAHDREVVTTSIGALVQHDASTPSGPP